MIDWLALFHYTENTMIPESREIEQRHVTPHTEVTV